MLAMPPEIWDFWQDQAHSPPFNMAADEVLLETAADRGRPLLRFYTWDRLAVSIGYIQRLDAAPAGYAAVRRPTGGGVVYHDHDFTYTVIFPDGHWLCGLDRLQSYDWLNRAVQAGLQKLNLQADLADSTIPHEVDRLNMICFNNPTRYDILLDGEKIAGSAQRRTRNGILHQGSLHFGGPLPLPRHALGEVLLQGFRKILQVTTQDYEPDANLLAQIDRRANEKYDTPEWNARR